MVNSVLDFLLSHNKRQVDYDGIPISLPFISKNDIFASMNNQNNEIALKLLRYITNLLNINDIPFSLVGSMSLLIQIPNCFKKPVHDIDIIVKDSDIDRLINIFQNSGLDVWDEKDLHKMVLNLTGGYGRHHNFGFCSNNYLGPLGLPIWGGIFCYSETEEGISFNETYAFSEWKAKSSLKYRSDLEENINTQDIDGDINDQCLEIQRLINIPAYWELLRESGLNLLDLSRREKIRESCILNAVSNNRNISDNNSQFFQNESFYDVVMTSEYLTSSSLYLFSKQVDIGDNLNVFVVPVEASYLRLSIYFPHYLGSRGKYVLQKEMIEKSGILDKNVLEYFNTLYQSAVVTHLINGVFEMKIYCDPTLDYKGLISIFQNDKSVLSKMKPNYLAMIQEGVHFTFGKN